MVECDPDFQLLLAVVAIIKGIDPPLHAQRLHLPLWQPYSGDGEIGLLTKDRISISLPSEDRDTLVPAPLELLA